MTTHKKDRGRVLDHACIDVMMQEAGSFNLMRCRDHGHWKPVGTRRPQ
jgi:hypothetical protein